ncbi:MAG: hypothetical protein RSD47_04245 [Romboutsia sp.]
MKRFLIVATIVFLLILSFLGNTVNNKIITLDNSHFVKANGKDIYILKDNEWDKLKIIGVNLNPTKPGVFPSENAVKEEEYLRWIQYIYDMGSNCIKVPNLMSQHFYNALEKFNRDKKNPIYLMQGIYFDEVILKNGYDVQENKLQEIFKTNIKLIIDSVHGNPYNFDKPDIIQFYNTDISEYLLGYTLGIEFAEHDIIYTEIMNDKKEYNGTYLYTDKNASSFESYMAKMGDYIASYELETYKKQSLISFIGSSSYHIVSGRDNPEGKSIVSKNNEIEETKDYIDPENIKMKKKLKTGIVASYNVYPSYSEIKEYQGKIDYYLKEINEHHTIPVIIGEFGIPSSRTSGDFNNGIINKGYINEQEQGEALIDTYKSIENANYAGSFIFQFQDSWHNSSSNTKESKILDRSAYWSDAQTYSQNFGIMAFDPGKIQSISYPDNNTNEWNEDDIVSNNDNINLSMKSDEKYIYLMVKSDRNLELDKQDIYIDLDITPKSGAIQSSQFGLKFESAVDFIISIKDKKNASVLVHDYYNRFKFYENKKDNQVRPDLISHTPDMDEFSPILIEVRPKIYIESLGEFLDKVSYETGKLIHGNANPKSSEFNSATDFYIGDNYIELRIPWGLVNFMDPSTKQIQDDFYKTFKTKSTMINNIGVGLTIKGEKDTIERLESTFYGLDGWIRPNYHERLKESYYILKRELTKT